MEREHHVIVCPGMGGGLRRLEMAAEIWENKYKLFSNIIPIEWYGRDNFGLTLKKITETVDNLINNGCKVSVIGISAGGSMALNVFIENSGKISRVVNVCGLLRVVTKDDSGTFVNASILSSVFRESVQRLNKLEDGLPNRENILTLSSTVDELVSPEATTIKGALNKQIVAFNHNQGILSALTFHDPLFSFLLDVTE